MATEKQNLGDFGEKMVVKNCHCPKCKKEKTLKLLPKNFKCADVVCDFCNATHGFKLAHDLDKGYLSHL